MTGIAIAEEIKGDSLAFKLRRQGFDPWLLLILVGLIAYGLIMVYSSSWDVSWRLHGDASALFRRQLTNLGLGVAAMLIAARLPMRWLRNHHLRHPRPNCGLADFRWRGHTSPILHGRVDPAFRVGQAGADHISGGLDGVEGRSFAELVVWLLAACHDHRNCWGADSGPTGFECRDHNRHRGPGDVCAGGGKVFAITRDHIGQRRCRGLDGDCHNHWPHPIRSFSRWMERRGGCFLSRAEVPGVVLFRRSLRPRVGGQPREVWIAAGAAYRQHLRSDWRGTGLDGGIAGIDALLFFHVAWISHRDRIPGPFGDAAGQRYHILDRGRSLDQHVGSSKRVAVCRQRSTFLQLRRLESGYDAHGSGIPAECFA